MAYLNLDPSYFEHPKTRRLTALLGPMSDVLPLRLWAYCAKVHPANGLLADYSVNEIESVIGWSGDSGMAVAALERVGFLDKKRVGWACHAWKEHEGHIISITARNRAAAISRWGKINKKSSQKCNASRINHACVTSPPTIPTIPAKQYLTTTTTERPKSQHQEVVEFFAEIRGIKLNNKALQSKFFATHGGAATELLEFTSRDVVLAKIAIREISTYLDRLVAENKINEWRNLQAIVNSYTAWKAEYDKDVKMKNDHTKQPV